MTGCTGGDAIPADGHTPPAVGPDVVITAQGGMVMVECADLHAGVVAPLAAFADIGTPQQALPARPGPPPASTVRPGPPQ